MTSARATAVNPHILVWARTRAGMGVEDIAAKLGKPADIIRAWESGEDFPTYVQLESVASQYGRPVALFFFPEPPDEKPVEGEFRTLPAADAATLQPDTLFALRDAAALQESLRELAGGRNPAAALITREVRPRRAESIEVLAARVRAALGVSLERQYSWRTARDAMRGWRDAVEARGVFVFKRPFEQDDISGFCIADDEFPIIVVNNSMPQTRQVFTLIHELAHLLFGESSIDKDDPTTAGRMSPEGRELELACNRLAANVLVPLDTFPFSDFRLGDVLATAIRVADQYGISREVILRILLERGIVNQETYAAQVQQWAQQGDPDEGGKGGSYYANEATYLGRAFLALAFSRYWAGQVSLEELAEHLRMKARNVVNLEAYLAARG